MPKDNVEATSTITILISNSHSKNLIQCLANLITTVASFSESLKLNIYTQVTVDACGKVGNRPKRLF
jgi:hypothetical protein